ncbi:hypothetical protein KC340_g125 [Hortaea werneckii]|nr:hypothetical protein KC340_g125 [Hortaea werneckii]
MRASLSLDDPDLQDYRTKVYIFGVLNLDRYRTTKRSRNGTTRAEDLNEAFDGRPSPHARTSKSGEEVQRCEGVDEEMLLVTPHPTLHAAVMAGCVPSNRIKSLTWQRGAALD